MSASDPVSSHLDDLARNLASSMSRGRALRMLGGAVVAAALPGLRARPAQARGVAVCPPGTEVCSNGKGSQVCMPAGGTCCDFPGLQIVGCKPGYQCGKPRTEWCRCDGVVCGNRCCPTGKDCEDGECVTCTSERKCGTDCCKKSEFCASPRQSLCCANGDSYCAVLPSPGSGLKAGKVSCCPKGTNCCANDKRTDCCGPRQTCRSGKCSCPSGTTECGPDCCKKDEICSNGKCCPKGKVNCGDGKCCKKGACCGKDCCPEGEFCASTIAYSKPKVCCTSSRIIVSPSGKPVCCPKGTVPNDSDTGCCPQGNPGCCGDETGDAVICLGNSMCVRGTCQRVS